MDSKNSKKLFSTKELAFVSVFVVVTAVLAQIAIPLPFTPVPFSLGLVGVFASGMLSRPKQAVMAQACYLLMGAVGAPVFGNFQGGPAALLGPTGGYLMAYPVMAGIVAAALNSRRARHIADGKVLPAANKVLPAARLGKIWTFAQAAASMLIALAVLYLCGTLWLSFVTGISFGAALALAVYPFIPLDLAKIAFCAAAAAPLRSRLMTANATERQSG